MLLVDNSELLIQTLTHYIRWQRRFKHQVGHEYGCSSLPTIEPVFHLNNQVLIISQDLLRLLAKLIIGNLVLSEDFHHTQHTWWLFLIELLHAQWHSYECIFRLLRTVLWILLSVYFFTIHTIIIKLDILLINESIIKIFAILIILIYLLLRRCLRLLLAKQHAKHASPNTTALFTVCIFVIVNNFLTLWWWDCS